MALKPFEYLKLLFEKLPNIAAAEIDDYLPWGAGVPEYCKMPAIKKEEAQDAS